MITDKEIFLLFGNDVNLLIIDMVRVSDYFTPGDYGDHNFPRLQRDNRALTVGPLPKDSHRPTVAKRISPTVESYVGESFKSISNQVLQRFRRSPFNVDA